MHGSPLFKGELVRRQDRRNENGTRALCLVTRPEGRTLRGGRKPLGDCGTLNGVWNPGDMLCMHLKYSVVQRVFLCDHCALQELSFGGWWGWVCGCGWGVTLEWGGDSGDGGGGGGGGVVMCVGGWWGTSTRCTFSWNDYRLSAFRLNLMQSWTQFE